MFGHRVGEIDERFKGDVPGALIVDLPSLSIDVLSALPGYLTETMDARHDLGDEDTHLGARPLAFSIDTSPELSERAIWQLLVELPDAADSVGAYVDAALAHTPDELAFCTARDVIAQEPGYAYIDRWLRRDALDRKAPGSDEARSVVDTFERFLNACDMDHEVHQDDYLATVIEYLWQDVKRQADFIVFRLQNGAAGGALSDQTAGWLRRRGALKAVVDACLGKPEGSWRLHEDILELCAVVYGSDSRCTSEVLAYCRHHVDFDDENIGSGALDSLNKRRMQQDLAITLYPTKISTGFHEYDKTSGQWTQSS